MDLLTHGLLGATLSQAFYAKRLGRAGTWIGGLAALTPDLDILYGAPDLSFLQYHRGYTHSFVGIILMGLALAALAHMLRRYQKIPLNMTLWAWWGFFALILSSHLFLDWLTSYGTQLFLPCSNQRFAADVVAVIDLTYTLPLLLVALWVGHLMKQGNLPLAQQMARKALGASGIFFLSLWGMNEHLIDYARQQLSKEGIVGARVSAYPTLLQPFYREVWVETDHEVRVGFATLLDLQPIKWTTRKIPQELGAISQDELWKTFIWFAGGHVLPEVTTLESGAKRVRLWDMRYVLPHRMPKANWYLEAVLKEEQVEEPLHFVQSKHLAIHSSGEFIKTIWNGMLHG